MAAVANHGVRQAPRQPVQQQPVGFLDALRIAAQPLGNALQQALAQRLELLDELFPGKLGVCGRGHRVSW